MTKKQIENIYLLIESMISAEAVRSNFDVKSIFDKQSKQILNNLLEEAE